MYQRILVPVRGDLDEWETVNHAVELAAAVGADVHGLYVVVEPPAYTHYGYQGLLPPEDVERERERGRVVLDEAAAIAAEHDVPFRSSIDRGTPHTRIVDTAVNENADAIVLPAPDRGSLLSVVRRGTTGRVIRGSPVVTITVP